jgi:hypothetical protein
MPAAVATTVLGLLVVSAQHLHNVTLSTPTHLEPSYDHNDHDHSHTVARSCWVYKTVTPNCHKLHFAGFTPKFTCALPSSCGFFRWIQQLQVLLALLALESNATSRRRSHQAEVWHGHVDL